MRNVSDKSCKENRKTHFIFSNFFLDSCRLWDNVEKYDTAGHATGDNIRNTAHLLCMLDNYRCKHALIVHNNFCSSTAEVVARTPLSVTLYVHFLSCCSLIPWLQPTLTKAGVGVWLILLNFRLPSQLAIGYAW